MLAPTVGTTSGVVLAKTSENFYENSFTTKEETGHLLGEEAHKVATDKNGDEILEQITNLPLSELI